MLFGCEQLFLFGECCVTFQTAANMAKETKQLAEHKKYTCACYLTIRLRARVFYEQIVNEAQPSWLSLVENEGE